MCTLISRSIICFKYNYVFLLPINYIGTNQLTQNHFKIQIGVSITLYNYLVE